MKGLGNAAVDLDCNVNIKIIDKHRRVVRDSSVHNKATVSLVDGILRFLRGDFTPTSYSTTSSPEEGVPYLPTKINFGYIGVDLSSEKPISPDGKPHFNFMNSGKFVQPVFSSSALQEPCLNKINDKVMRDSPIQFTFDKVRQVGYSDANNAECLEFTIYISPGNLVGSVFEDELGNRNFVPFTHSYWNPSIGEYEAMVTEIGLISDDDLLLARVLFDGEVGSDQYVDENGTDLGRYPVPEDRGGDFTPIVQSQSSTVVITWRIGIVSVGKNDKLVTETDLDVNRLASQTTMWVKDQYDIVSKELREEVVSKLATDVLGAFQVSSRSGEVLTLAEFSSELSEIIDHLLNENSVSLTDLSDDLSGEFSNILNGSTISSLKGDS